MQMNREDKYYKFSYNKLCNLLINRNMNKDDLQN